MSHLERRVTWGALICIGIALLLLSGCKEDVGAGDTAWNEYVAPYRHSLEVEGLELHYIDIGRGKPLVLIHGFADSTYCFHENLKPLVEAGYRVILIDQPGMGRSEIPSDDYTYSIENQAAGVAGLVEALGVDRYTIGGSSMGGGISLYLALTKPESIERLILFDPACFDLGRHGMMPFAERPGLRDVIGAATGRWAVGMALQDVYYDRRKVTVELLDEYARPLDKDGYRKALIRLLTEYHSPRFKWMSMNYSALTKPTFIFWGRQDRWVPLEFGRRLNAALPNSHLEIIDKSGHLPHQERPELVNPLLLDFLRNGE
ncbi:MAG: alpha/beta hydrolase [Candidatus Lernaella stagnicola]|nr:alpha/beta hydrolase [Candidatus Lernaella stagnicola]